MNDPAKRKPTYRIPCPQPPKGTICPLCDGRFVCLSPDRPKSKRPPQKKTKP